MCKYPISNSQYSISLRHHWILDIGYWIIAHFPLLSSPHRDKEKIDLLALLGIVLVAEEAPEEGRL